MFSDNYPPYSYINEKGELVGFNVDILNAIIKLDTIKINIKSGDWKTINENLENGKIQAIGGDHIPGISDDEYFYTRSAINTSHCFFYNTNYHSKFSLEILRSINQPTIALWNNDVLIKYVQSINPTAKFVFVKDYNEFVSIIDRKDITCFFGQRVGCMFYAHKFGKDYVKPLNHRILERNMGFKVSKNAPELSQMLSNGLEVILANGDYQKIYDKWIETYDKDYNQTLNYEYLLLISTIIALIILILLIINWVLQTRVREKTKDLRNQLVLNSEIMNELEMQKNKAEESDKMKSAFLANMSHEIRTPMNGILGFADLLRNNDYSAEKQDKFLDIIQKSGKRMLETINNIIDVSKLESGLEKPQFKEVNIKKIISDLFNFFNAEATAKGINLTLNEELSTATTPFYTDEYKLNSILTNLIKNAIKFTSKGSVDIYYTLTNDYATFKVSDSGIGIPFDKQPYIFDQFVQADYSHSSGYEGSGLGLSISKGYVALLQGEIKLDSAPNTGTTFTFKIPNSTLQNSSLNNLQSTATTFDKTVIQKFDFLIAEDDDTSYYFLEQILADYTNTIQRAKDGEEVILKLKENPATSVILMDIKMPKLNGFEATTQIRTFNEQVYIIAQSAYIQESIKTKAHLVGCNAFISKPIDTQNLYTILNAIKLSTKDV
jgi:signal transduction histidine kinase/ActR/RegA family two-component response regulator